MSIGTGIFLSAVFLSTVLLFNATKDRWNWGKLLKRFLVIPAGAVGIGIAAYIAYELWAGRPQPQIEFNGVGLGASNSDVKFVLGEPMEVDGPDRWIYSGGHDDARYLVQFSDGRVKFVLYTANPTKAVNPWLLGFSLQANVKEVKDALGEPSHVNSSADELDRIFSYEKLNVFFSFRQGKVIAYGIYRPELGPMKFRRADP